MRGASESSTNVWIFASSLSSDFVVLESSVFRYESRWGSFWLVATTLGSGYFPCVGSLTLFCTLLQKFLGLLQTLHQFGLLLLCIRVWPRHVFAVVRFLRLDGGHPISPPSGLSSLLQGLRLVIRFVRRREWEALLRARDRDAWRRFLISILVALYTPILYML